MKSLKTILAVALVMGGALPMTAQFSNSGGGGGSSTYSDAPQSYNILSIGYDYTTLDFDGEDESTNGLALQYTNGTKVSANHPLYFEWGLRGSLGFWSDSDDDYDWEEKLTTLNVTVPLNIAYRISIGETASLTPYTGLHAKGNLLASFKIEDDGDSETLNMFDKDDVGKNSQWKRFQFGWQIGARLSFNTFHVGIEYGLDFNEICKKGKTSNFMASIGFNI